MIKNVTLSKQYIRDKKVKQVEDKTMYCRKDFLDDDLHCL